MSMTPFYNLRPDQIKPGMVFAVTVTCHIAYDGEARLYRCPFPNAELNEEGVPQGDRLYKNEEEVLEALFPVVLWQRED